MTIEQITDLVRGVHTYYKSGEVPVRELERFHADGRSGELNRYVTLDTPVGTDDSPSAAPHLSGKLLPTLFSTH